jgi:AcrR family transcriptional regulator
MTSTNTHQEGLPNSARERILDASLKIFGERGFSGATTKEIARRAKVNEVTVFRLFKTKRALFSSVMLERSPLIQVKSRLSLNPTASIDDLIHANMRTVLGVLRDNKSMFMVMLGDAWRHPKSRTMLYDIAIRRGLEFVTEFVKAQIDAGRIRRTDPEIAARALMGMMQSYFLLTDMLEARAPDEEEDERTIRGFVSVFLDGMRTEKGAVGK